jgi:hypothetical protein
MMRSFGGVSTFAMALAHLRRFRGVETTIFHYTESWKSNGGHSGDRTLDQTRSLFDWMCPVSVQRLRVSQLSNRTRWHVRSRSIGRVRSIRELTGLQPDAGTVTSGQFSSASGRCFVERCSDLTSASSPSRDQL